jgi:raffinose/stachyose/melibiose transport system permease protein
VSSRAERLVNYVILSIFALVILIPMALLVLLAMRPSDIAGAGFQFTRLDFGNFIQAWTQSNFGHYLINSAIIACGTIVIAGSLAVAAGYALATMDLPGNTVIFYFFLSGVMIPLTAVIVPLYYNFLSLGLTNSLGGLIIAQSGMSLSFGVFWMRSYFRSFPRNLIESADLDGSSRWSTLWRICVPNARPAILSMVLLMFMWVWSDYLLALVMISSDTLNPATLALGVFQSRHVTQYNLLAAGAILVALPIVVIYVVFQRHFIRGVFSGALK